MAIVSKLEGRTSFIFSERVPFELVCIMITLFSTPHLNSSDLHIRQVTIQHSLLVPFFNGDFYVFMPINLLRITFRHFAIPVLNMNTFKLIKDYIIRRQRKAQISSIGFSRHLDIHSPFTNLWPEIFHSVIEGWVPYPTIVLIFYAQRDVSSRWEINVRLKKRNDKLPSLGRNNNLHYGFQGHEVRN